MADEKPKDKRPARLFKFGEATASSDIFGSQQTTFGKRDAILLDKITQAGQPVMGQKIHANAAIEAPQ